VREAYGVLVLHGPPCFPRFYGQLERHNREHRTWLNALGLVEPAELEVESAAMRKAFNSVRPLCSLGWRTPESVWQCRPPMRVDRLAFREEVRERTQRLVRELEPSQRYEGLAERLGIEAALTERGWLIEKQGGWC